MSRLCSVALFFIGVQLLGVTFFTQETSAQVLQTQVGLASGGRADSAFPIMIGLVLVWKVEDTFKSAFGVDEFEHFVVVQSEAALRKLAGLYPYVKLRLCN